jgi:hypothetical protein
MIGGAACGGDVAAAAGDTGSPLVPDATGTSDLGIAETTVVADSSQAAVEPLLLAFTYHLEGAQLVASRDAFDRYVEGIRKVSQLFRAHGAIPTWDSAEIVGKSIAYDVNILKELENSGDDIGLHANGVGYIASDPDYTLAEMTLELTKQRDEILSLGVDVRHVSNICSVADWVTAVRETGFDAATAMVDFCLKSLADPGDAASCTSPGMCHDAYPGTVEGQMSAWHAESGANWTEPAPSGLLLVPTAGAVNCAAEAARGDVSPTHCEYDAGDAAAVLDEVGKTIAARKPGVRHSMVLVASFGKVPDEAVMTELLSQIKARHVDTGQAVWVGFRELIDRLEAP